MGDSYEKRKRNQKKQKKREDKLTKRVQRNAEKASHGSNSTTPVLYRFRRGEEEYLIDSDIWLCTLDLATYHGWTPLVDTRELDRDMGSYTRPRGITLSKKDAESLANALEELLPRIEDDEQPLSDVPFGEHYTEYLLAQRSAGEEVSGQDVLAARELLSGTPKREAQRLAEFLKDGAFSVDE